MMEHDYTIRKFTNPNADWYELMQVDGDYMMHLMSLTPDEMKKLAKAIKEAGF